MNFSVFGVAFKVSCEKYTHIWHNTPKDEHEDRMASLYKDTPIVKKVASVIFGEWYGYHTTISFVIDYSTLCVIAKSIWDIHIGLIEYNVIGIHGIKGTSHLYEHLVIGYKCS